MFAVAQVFEEYFYQSGGTAKETHLSTCVSGCLRVPRVDHVVKSVRILICAANFLTQKNIKSHKNLESTTACLTMLFKPTANGCHLFKYLHINNFPN